MPGTVGLQPVSEKEVGRAVLRVVVRRRVAILGLALEVYVRTEVEIHRAVAVIVGGGHAGEAPLRRTGELKRVLTHGEPAIAVVQQKQRSCWKQDHEVLAAEIAEIDKESRSGIIEQPDSSALRN